MDGPAELRTRSEGSEYVDSDLFRGYLDPDLLSSLSETGGYWCKAQRVPVFVCSTQPDEHRLSTRPSRRLEFRCVNISAVRRHCVRSTDGPVIPVIVIPSLRQRSTSYITMHACVVAGLPPSVLHPFILSFTPVPSFLIHRYEAFDFFVYVVTLAFLQAGTRFVLERGGAFICIS